MRGSACSSSHISIRAHGTSLSSLPRRVAAAGEDRQVASRISATIDLSLEPRAAGTVVTVHGRYEITGRIATLGSGAIRKKGDKILEKFFANLGRELGARDLTADPAPS